MAAGQVPTVATRPRCLLRFQLLSAALPLCSATTPAAVTLLLWHWPQPPNGVPWPCPPTCHPAQLVVHGWLVDEVGEGPVGQEVGI